MIRIGQRCQGIDGGRAQLIGFFPVQHLVCKKFQGIILRKAFMGHAQRRSHIGFRLNVRHQEQRIIRRFSNFKQCGLCNRKINSPLGADLRKFRQTILPGRHPFIFDTAPVSLNRIGQPLSFRKRQQA